MTGLRRPILLAMLVLLAAGCRSYDPDVYDSRLRSATFEAYHGAIVDYYPDLDRVGLDAGLMRTKWEEAVVDAESATEYYHALGRMCAALDDPHVSLTPNYELWSEEEGPLGATDLRIVEVDGRPRLWNMGQDLQIEWGGRQKHNYNGWEVQAFDGSVPNNDIVDDVINIGPRHSRIEIHLSSPADHSPKVLPRKRGLPVEVTELDEIDINRTGTSLYRDTREATRTAIEDRAQDAQVVRSYVGTYLDAWRVDNMGILVWNPSKTLPGKKGLSTLKTDLEEAGKVFEGTSCALVDFRFQGGGLTPGFRAVMEKLLDTRVKMTLRQQSWFGFRKETDHIKESPAIITGPVVVLVNEFTASYGEWMTSLMKREQEATIVGARTQGCEFCIVEIEGPDRSRLRFGGKPYTRTDGIPPFQSVGIQPDIEIRTMDDQFDDGSLTWALVETHETQMETALALLESMCQSSRR